MTLLLRKLSVAAAALIFLSLTLLSMPVASYSQGSAQSTPTPGSSPVQIVRINTDAHPQIEIVVGALDPTGKPLLGLTANDFSVYEDDKPIAIQTATGITDSNIPLLSVLVIDTSLSMAGVPLADAKAAANQFVDQVRDIDQLALITFNSTVTVLQPPTQDKALIKTKINALTAHDETALYDAIAQAVKTAQGVTVQRRAIVLLTDGAEYGGLSKTGRDEAFQLANKAGIPVFTIGLGYGMDEAYLKAVADNTGGQFYRSPKAEDLYAIYGTIGKLLRSLYVLTIQTKLPADGTTHKIKVVLNSNAAAFSERSARYPAPIPVITLSGLDPNVPITQPILITPYITADNALTSFDYQVDGKSVLHGDGAATALTIDPMTLTPGKHTLTLSATDNKGHVGSGTLDFQVASLPPVFKISGLSAGETLNADRVVTVTVVQSQTPLVSVAYAINGVSLSADQQPPYSATIHILSLEPGSHQLTATVQNHDAIGKQTINFSVAPGPRATVTAVAAASSTAVAAVTTTAEALAQNTEVAAASNTAVVVQAAASNTAVAAVTTTAEAIAQNTVVAAATNTAAVAQTLAALPSLTPLPTETETASATALPTATTVPSDTATPLPTAADTAVPPTATPTFTDTVTPSNTFTPTATATLTPSSTSTPTATTTPTITPTWTPTPTPTPIPVVNRVINLVSTPIGLLCAGVVIVLLLIALLILDGRRNPTRARRP